MGIAGPRPLRSVLTGVTRSLGLDDPVEGLLHAHWAQIVGQDVAALCRVEKFDDGRLSLGADNPVTRYELSMRREALKAQINAFLGEDKITQVHVKLKEH